MHNKIPQRAQGRKKGILGRFEVSEMLWGCLKHCSTCSPLAVAGVDEATCVL